MERRAKARKVVRGDVDGSILMVDWAEVQDVSLSGIRIKSRRRLDPNTKQSIALRHHDTTLQMPGTVIRSSIKGTRSIEGRTVHIYEVAMAFDPLPQEKIETLKTLFRDL